LGKATVFDIGARFVPLKTPYDRLIEICKRIRADILLFFNSQAPVIGRSKEFCEDLQQHQLSMPSLILPGEVLFVPDKPVNISKYFEVRNNQFFAGPVVL
jgi:hypothetical protein